VRTHPGHVPPGAQPFHTGRNPAPRLHAHLPENPAGLRVTPPTETKNPIQVVERMMKLLDVLAHHPDPAPLKQIAQETGLHPSTAHRILARWRKADSSSGGEGGNLSARDRLLELGSLVKSRISLRETAMPAMLKLHAATAESVNLGIRDGDEIVLSTARRAGARRCGSCTSSARAHRCHTTATGKLFLVEEGIERVRDYARRTGLPASTSKLDPRTRRARKGTGQGSPSRRRVRPRRSRIRRALRRRRRARRFGRAHRGTVAVDAVRTLRHEPRTAGARSSRRDLPRPRLRRKAQLPLKHGAGIIELATDYNCSP